MGYKIKIQYHTGDSFKSEDLEEYLDLTWENLDVAKENLQRIKEHYTQYQECNDYYYGRNKTNVEIYKGNMDKDWFVLKNDKILNKLNNCYITEKEAKQIGQDNWEIVPVDYFAQHCLKLKTDGGIDYQLTAFWCGYFERLYSAEIEIDNSDMKINF